MNERAEFIVISRLLTTLCHTMTAHSASLIDLSAYTHIVWVCVCVVFHESINFTSTSMIKEFPFHDMARCLVCVSVCMFACVTLKTNKQTNHNGTKNYKWNPERDEE